eukprot:200343-Pleurochrysis_carterae.AAC.3
MPCLRATALPSIARQPPSNVRPFFPSHYTHTLVSTQGVARLFLTGFGSTALFGAVVGGLIDSLGRKRGSLAFALMYALSALSTKCGTLPLLLAGRVAGGLGTSLLFSAPEAWLVSEHTRNGLPGAALAQTFGLAYFGDAIVAIVAGQLAGAVASRGARASASLGSGGGHGRAREGTGDRGGVGDWGVGRRGENGREWEAGQKVQERVGKRSEESRDEEMGSC